MAVSRVVGRATTPYAICMNHWHRVFGSDPAPPALDILVGLARRFFPPAELHAEVTDLGWQRDKLQLPAGSSPPIERTTEGVILTLHRYRREEEGIRGELQAWATAIEQRVELPAQEILLRQVATAQQILTLDVATAEGLPLAFALCRHLATRTAGTFQIDGRGYFDAEGHLLLEEEAHDPLS